MEAFPQVADGLDEEALRKRTGMYLDFLLDPVDSRVKRIEIVKNDD